MTGTVTVVNRFTPKNHPDVIRKMITRWASPVGNPFVVGKDGDRDTCCDAYEKYVFSGLIWSNKKFVEWINERIWEYEDGKDIELVCGCKPQRCHGDSLRKLIIDLATSEIPADVVAEEEAWARSMEVKQHAS